MTVRAATSLRATPVLATDRVDLRPALRTFLDVTARARDGGTLDDLLALVAEGFCELVGAARGSLFLRDSRPGYFRGRAAFGAQRGLDELIARQVAGGDADGLTRELLATRRPVLIRDARSDPRPVRAAMRAWNVRSILGVPLLVGDDTIGLCFIDHEELSHLFTPPYQELVMAFGELAAAAIVQAEEAEALATAAAEASSRAELARSGVAIDHHLTGLVSAGKGLREIVDALGTVTAKPCSVHDGAGRRIAAVHAPGDDGGLLPTLLDDANRLRPDVVECLRRAETSGPSLAGPFPSLAIHHRHLICPVVVRRRQWGHIVVMEHRGRLGPFDELAAGAAARAAELALFAQHDGAVETTSDGPGLDTSDTVLAQLLAGSGGWSQAERFAEDTLGELLVERDERSAGLLDTLLRFFACGRSVGRAADALDVHENTVRYRLARVEAATGLAISGTAPSGATDRLRVELALTVLRLQGRLAPVRSA